MAVARAVTKAVRSAGRRVDSMEIPSAEHWVDMTEREMVGGRDIHWAGHSAVVVSLHSVKWKEFLLEVELESNLEAPMVQLWALDWV